MTRKHLLEVSSTSAIAKKPAHSSLHSLAVVGIGSAGIKMLDGIASDENNHFDRIALGLDQQALHSCRADRCLDLGHGIGKRSGAGADPIIGRRAVMYHQDMILDVLAEYDVIILIGGLGRGTCSGAAPSIASLCKERLDASIIGMFSAPFHFEGNIRNLQADNALKELIPILDSLFLIQNNLYLEAGLVNSNKVIDYKWCLGSISSGIRVISEIVNNSGMVKLDAANLKYSLNDHGMSFFSYSAAEGKNRISHCIKGLFSSPLAKNFPFSTADRLILTITSSSDMTIGELAELIESIRHKTSLDADVQWGLTQTDSAQKTLSVGLIAGTPKRVRQVREAPRVTSEQAVYA